MSLKRRTPLRSDPAKTRAWQDRSRAPLPASTKRGREKRKVQMGDDTGFGAQLRRLPCAGCWVEWWRLALRLGTVVAGDPMDEPPSQVAHLAPRSEGHGVRTVRPTKCGHAAAVPNVIPLCAGCHQRQEKRTAAWGVETAGDAAYGWTVAALVAKVFG